MRGPLTKATGQITVPITTVAVLLVLLGDGLAAVGFVIGASVAIIVLGRLR